MPTQFCHKWRTRLITLADRYIDFARIEAAGRSAIYERLALHVAESSMALRFLEQLPQERQQPNLLFAAIRFVQGTPQSPEELDQALEDHTDEIMAVMQARTTQTNEPARCATLLPVFSQINGPIALIEVGASAGLCLLLDMYGYDWDRKKLDPPNDYRGIAPVFRCDATGNTPLPTHHPEIVWRAGLDLNPLDAASAEDTSWLEALIWPEHHDRLANLRAALRVARTNSPNVLVGDLREDLAGLIDEAPSDATIVVFHTAVLTYVSSQSDRDEFAEMMLKASVEWLSNEGQHVFPKFPDLSPSRRGRFLLARNGKPTAWTGPHGQSVEWIEQSI